MIRIVAISLRPYHTWPMRITLTLLILAVAAMQPLQASAFDLEENLRAQHVQYAGKPLLLVQQDGMSLSQATASVRSRLRPGDRIVSAETKVRGGREVHYIKVLTKDGKVKTHKVNGRLR